MTGPSICRLWSLAFNNECKFFRQIETVSRIFLAEGGENSIYQSPEEFTLATNI
jgi:hypothetical protein